MAGAGPSAGPETALLVALSLLFVDLPLSIYLYAVTDRLSRGPFLRLMTPTILGFGMGVVYAAEVKALLTPEVYGGFAGLLASATGSQWLTAPADRIVLLLVLILASIGGARAVQLISSHVRLRRLQACIAVRRSARSVTFAAATEA